MKTLPAALAAVSLLLMPCIANAADAKAELQALVGKVQDKLKAGKNTEKDLADELKAFDDTLAEHHGEKTDDVAQILFMKAMLYVEILEDSDKGVVLIKQVKTDFPDSKQAQNADKILASIAQHAEAAKIQKSLAVGNPFPGFDEKDLDGKSLSIAGFKGKVLLVDFWATWCGPCVGELPNVLKTYEKYHDKGLEIVGISLDQDKEKLTSFIKEKKVAWQQYFDGQGWQNKLAQKYGIQSIPATFLLDKDGKIIARDVRGEALEAAVAKATGN